MTRIFHAAAADPDDAYFAPVTRSTKTLASALPSTMKYSTAPAMCREWKPPKSPSRCPPDQQGDAETLAIEVSAWLICGSFYGFREDTPPSERCHILARRKIAELD